MLIQTGQGASSLFRFRYTNTTTRDAATGFVQSDVNSLAQTDDGSVYVITAVSVAGLATWASFNNAFSSMWNSMVENVRQLANAADGANYVYYTAPATADLVSVKAAADAANGAITIVANSIDYPRKLQVRIVDADSSISAGTLTLVGVDINGKAITESISLTGGTATKITTYAYASLTSGTVAGLTGAVTGDTLGIGVGTALALPRTTKTGTKVLSVTKANVNNVNEAVGTLDTAVDTISPTTAPNASRSYGFWYTYA